ncbi:DNA recombination protein RmuC [Rickettsiales bacterium LUAb2]
MLVIYFIIGIALGIIIGFLISYWLLKNNYNSLITQISNQQKEDINSALNKVFLNTGDYLTNNYAGRVDSILKPFKENILEFKQRVEAIHTEETKQVGELKGQIDKMFMAQQRLSTEANNLASALRGNVKQQGMWGEEILKRVLEHSGLKKDVNYLEQVSYTEDGTRKQPDIIIKLPDTRDIIIDSKLSLNSYVEYSNAEEAEKELYLKEIKNALLRHIDNLNSKEYYNISELNTVKAVFIFIPLEGLFLLLVEKFPNIFLEAAAKNIYITSPISLMPLLKLIENLWTVHSQNKNVIEMSKVAGKIYDKTVGIVEEVINIKTSVSRVEKNIDSLEIKLKGKDNIIYNIQKLADLGASKSKNFPHNWQEEIDNNLINKE